MFSPFVFSSSDAAKKLHPQLQKLVASEGGAFKATLGNTVTHLLVTEDELTKPKAKVLQAIQRNIPLVRYDFVTSSIAAGSLLPIADSILTIDSPSAANRVIDNNVEEVEIVNPKAKKAKVAPEEVVEEIERRPVTVTAIKKGRTIVDHECPVAHSSHVVERGPDVYDAMLNQTNIGANNNKFYILQILKTDHSDSYYFWTRWGRVGARGQDNKCESCSFDTALRLFRKKFHDKTGNQWEDRSDFQKHHSKYYLIERDFGTEKDDIDEQPVNPAVKSRLEPRVKAFMEMIFSIDMMNKQMVKIGYDVERMPLGKLSKGQIRKGYDILSQLSQQMKDSKKRKDLDELSSAFYTVIPHIFGFKRPPVIDSPAMVKDKLEMLDALQEMQVATELLKSSIGKDADEHPADANFKSLNCGLEPLDQSDSMFQLICDYAKRTHGSTHNQYELQIEEVFVVSRTEEINKFRSDIDNKMLLWHGSRISNFAGILSKGLRIAPPEAPATGYMFGKGIYFADMVSKSANYCCVDRRDSSPHGLLLLCEVGIGNSKTLVDAHYSANELVDMKKFHSVKGVGRTSPDHQNQVKLDGDVVVPIGSPKQANESNRSLLYNEYIVYNCDQVRIRYVVKTRFQFK